MDQCLQIKEIDVSHHLLVSGEGASKSLIGIDERFKTFLQVGPVRP